MTHSDGHVMIKAMVNLWMFAGDQGKSRAGDVTVDVR